MVVVSSAEDGNRAARRWCDLEIEMGKPSPEQVGQWFDRLAASLGGDAAAGRDAFARACRGMSFRQVNALSLAIRRAVVLSRGALGPGNAILEAAAKSDEALSGRRLLPGGP